MCVKSLAAVASLAVAGVSQAALVAYFPLDGPLGPTTTADDIIDDPTHGVTDATANNGDASYVLDPTRGVVLDSPDGNRFSAGSQDIVAADGFTWSLWVNVSSSYNGGNPGAGDSIIGTRNGSWHKVTVSAGVDGPGFADNGNDYIGGFTFADDTWHHIGYVGDTSGMKFYVDGVLRAEDNSVTAGTPAGLQFNFGGDGRFNENVDALLDDIAVWNERLSEERIIALANGARVIPDPASIALLAIGGLLFTGRRRRN